jgi:hypothetical protein
VVAWACALATLVALLAPGGATAAYDPVGSGSTTLALAKPFAKLLAEHHVKILVKGGAAKRGQSIVLPASAGEIDPVLGAGTVETKGSIVFAAGRRQVPLRNVTFKAKRAPLYAKVGGGQLKIATAARLEDRRSGFGVSFDAGGLKLTAKAATRLDKKLRLGGAVRAGQMIGSLKATAQPTTVHLLEEGRVQLALDQSFKQKLDSLFVSINPVAPAELTAGPVLSFPIGLESTLAPDVSTGTMKLGGSVELLQLGSAQLFWREVWLQPGGPVLLAESEILPSPPHPGKQPSAPVFSLQGGTVVSDPSARTISVSGQVISLDAATAAALNGAFSGSASTFVPGEAVGSLSFLARSQ